MPPKGTTKSPSCLGAVFPHSDGWRVVATVVGRTVFGPVHVQKRFAEADLARARAAQNQEEYCNILRQLRDSRAESLSSVASAASMSRSVAPAAITAQENLPENFVSPDLHGSGADTIVPNRVRSKRKRSTSKVSESDGVPAAYSEVPMKEAAGLGVSRMSKLSAYFVYSTSPANMRYKDFMAEFGDNFIRWCDHMQSCDSLQTAVRKLKDGQNTKHAGLVQGGIVGLVITNGYKRLKGDLIKCPWEMADGNWRGIVSLAALELNSSLGRKSSPNSANIDWQWNGSEDLKHRNPDDYVVQGAPWQLGGSRDVERLHNCLATLRRNDGFTCEVQVLRQVRFR